VWSWIALDPHAREVASAVGWVPPACCGSSTHAECLALIEALRWATAHVPDASIECRTDAIAVVERLTTPVSDWNSPFNALCRTAAALLEPLDVQLRWVPRCLNRRAHQLCTQAVKAFVARHAPQPPAHPTEATRVWQRLTLLARALQRPKSEVLAWLLDHAPLAERARHPEDPDAARASRRA